MYTKVLNVHSLSAAQCMISTDNAGENVTIEYLNLKWLSV